MDRAETRAETVVSDEEFMEFSIFRSKMLGLPMVRAFDTMSRSTILQIRGVWNAMFLNVPQKTFMPDNDPDL